MVPCTNQMQLGLLGFVRCFVSFFLGCIAICSYPFYPFFSCIPIWYWRTKGGRTKPLQCRSLPALDVRFVQRVTTAVVLSDAPGHAYPPRSTCCSSGSRASASHPHGVFKTRMPVSRARASPEDGEGGGSAGRWWECCTHHPRLAARLAYIYVCVCRSH